jgi:hypothetical protein
MLHVASVGWKINLLDVLLRQTGSEKSLERVVGEIILNLFLKKQIGKRYL